MKVERKETGTVSFSSHSTQKVINPNATGVGGTQTSSIRPTHPPKILTQKRPYQTSGCIRTPPAETHSQETVTGGKVKNTPGSGHTVREQQTKRPPRSPLSANGSLRSGDDECGEAARPIRLQGGQGEEMGGEAGGDGDRATSTEVSHLGMRGTLPHLQHNSNWTPEEGPQLLFSSSPHAAPCKRGEAAETPYYRWPSFYVVCRKKEGVGQLGAGELTCGLAGLRAGSVEEGCQGLGDSMRGPWTERRSWHCPACARCGQPCSPCSPAEPKETGCEYGSSRGARVCGKRATQPQGTFS